MSNSQLVGANFQDGLLSPYFFNGRLLAAEDLQLDQDTMLARLAILGTAIGYGVISGLRVTGAKNTTTLQITKGTGLNSAGHIIRLPNPATLSLSPQSGTTSAPPNTGKFGDCDLASLPTGGAINTGVYLLTVMPSSRFEGKVAYKAAAGSTSPPGCANKWERDGLVFKAIPISSALFPITSAVTDRNIQNLLAHWCFGSLELQHLADDPFHFDDRFTGIDLIPHGDLTPCDLPLAVFYWKNGALQFVDAWSARRRLVRPGAWDGLTGSKDDWSGLLSDKRIAEGQARFLQFQHQIDAFLDTGKAGSVKASDYFRFLPPVGFLPINPSSLLKQLDKIGAREGAKAYLRERMAKMATQTKSAAAGRTFLAEEPLSFASRRAAETTMDKNVLELQDYMAAVADEVAELRVELEKRAPAAGGAAAAPAPSNKAKERQARLARERQLRLDLLRSGLGAMQVKGEAFDLENFFGTLPRRIGLISRETVDFSLNRSWLDEAIDLTVSSRQQRVEFLIVEDTLKNAANQPYVMFVKAMRPIGWVSLGKKTGVQ